MLENNAFSVITYTDAGAEMVSSEFFKVGDLKPGTRVEVFFQGQDEERRRQETLILEVNPTKQEGNSQVLIEGFEGQPRSIGGGTLCRRFLEPIHAKKVQIERY